LCVKDSLSEHSPIYLDSPGRSGARFFLSHDKQFIVKTVDGDEYEELCRILRDYHQVSQSVNNRTNAFRACLQFFVTNVLLFDAGIR